MDRRIVARWDTAEAASVPLLAQAGIQAVLTESPGVAFASACREAGIDVLAPDALAFADVTLLQGAPPGKPLVFTGGVWPGLVQFDGMAGATSGPWVDANLHWAGWLRTLYPKREALLGYVPKADDRILPPDSLELALVEAWVMGGNYLLALPPGLKEGLLRKEERALQAWERLGRTTRFLREHAALFGQPLFPNLTVLVEGGETTAELANLMHRRSLSPALAPATDPPAPDPRLLVLVAVDIAEPAPAVGRRILAHAERGATVVVNGKWWQSASGLERVSQEEDRDIFRLGRGKVAAYRDAIGDPGEFAYDVIDFVGQERRATRLWQAPAAIAVAAGKGILYIVNYGRPIEWGALARIHGRYTRGRLLRPEASEIPLEPKRRDAGVEVEIPQLRRLAVAIFE